VSNNRIASITYGFSAPACGVSGTATMSGGTPATITNGGFTFSGQSTVSGTFSSTTAVSGTLTINYVDYQFNCKTTVNTTWSATRQ